MAARERWTRTATGLAVGIAAGLLARDVDLPTVVSYWKERSPLIVVAALLGALLWNTRLRWVAGAAVLALAGLWSLAAFTPLSAWLTDGLVRRDAIRPADAVFVLASRLQQDGEPSTTAMSRLVHGLELLAEGHAPRLILSELPPPSRSYATFARGVMGRFGLGQEVLAVGPVRNTRDEAVALGQLCRARGWRRLLVVTSPSHSKRASAAIEREGLEVISSPAIETGFDLESLDRPDDRLMAFGRAVHERVGIWVYERRGWLSPSVGQPATR